MQGDRAAVQAVLDQVRAEGRTVLTAPEGKQVCEAYGIPVPKEGLATSAARGSRLAQEIGYPVVLKIVSTDILHKTDAGGVLTGLASAAAVEQGYSTILANARAYKKPRRASWACKCSRCCQPPRRSSLVPSLIPALASSWPLAWGGSS